MRINPIAENILIAMATIAVVALAGWTIWLVHELFIIFRGIGLF